MRVRLPAIAAAALVCLAATDAHAQAPAAPLVRSTLRNDVGIELLGKAALYSFSYQRMVATSLGLEVGLGAVGGGSGADNTLIVFVPVSAKLYLIPKDGTLYVTAGPVLATAAADAGPFSDSATDFYGQVGLGFEFRSPGGFTFRGTAYGLFASGDYFIWPGLSVGYAF